MSDRVFCDTLISGGGIAGLCLAWSLQAKGQRVKLLDAGDPPPASAVAAGVLNPVTGRSITLGENIEEYLPAARKFYRLREKETGIPFFQDVGIRRFLLSASERERYEARREDDNYRKYMGAPIPPGTEGCGLEDEFGSFRIHRAGWVNLPLLLRTMQLRLEARGVWEHRSVAAGEIQADASGITYQEIKADRIVFCEGVSVLTNPWFSWLPFRPVRGETVQVAISGPPFPHEIIHHRKWILPLPQGEYLLGSTYRKGGFAPEGTAMGKIPPVRTDEEAVAEMIRVMDSCLRGRKILRAGHAQSGIRPCSRDRIPYLGPHPDQERVFIFNGLGSKGTLLAPLLAESLADHFIENKPLRPETNPARMVDRGFAPCQP